MKKILSILKSIGIITGVGAVIVSTTIAFNNNKHRQEQMQSDLKKVIISDSVQTIRVNILLTRTDENTEILTALRNSYVNKSFDELRKEMLTTEEFIKYMQGIGFEDIKKNYESNDRIASNINQK